MTQLTKKSTKSYHNVYIYEDYSILEVRRNDLYYIYEIENGTSSLLIEDSPNPYTPENGKKAEDYYLDYLSSEDLRQIDILTQNFDYSELIESLNVILKNIENDDYSYADFNMQMAYVFEDVKDSLCQLAEFLQDGKYHSLYKEYDVFFDTYFYNRNSSLSNNELVEIKNKFNTLIKFLKTLTIN